MTENIIIGCVYRPPGWDINVFNEEMSELNVKLNNLNKHVYLLGDYNIDLLKCNSHKSIFIYKTRCLPHHLSHL